MKLVLFVWLRCGRGRRWFARPAFTAFIVLALLDGLKPPASALYADSRSSRSDADYFPNFV